MRLSNANLSHLHPDVAIPAYDRTSVRPGVVHLGIGAFFRAHGAVAIDDCLAAGARDWGIVAASLRSPATRDALEPQDGLYTLALRDTDRQSLRVIGALTGVVVAPEHPERLLRALSDPRVRLVTLTITEKGYAVDLGTGGLRSGHPDVEHDLADPSRPRSALGFLAEAIDRRRRAGSPPFTVLSCDNLPKNGATLRRVLGDFARARDPDLGRFVAETISFPSCMVDRIVPATTDADRASVAEALGATDAWPVLGEPFLQWVIEDQFPAGRPELERGGADFVADVEPFEHMKLRLLNGAHSAVAAVGRVAGYDTVAEAIADPTIRRFVEAFWQEVIPTLAIGPEDARAYTRRLLDRFGNRSLRHLTSQIATDASQKIPQRIVAPLRERLAVGAPTDALTFAVAAWIRSCRGHDDAGRPLPLNDPTFAAWADRPDADGAAPEAAAEAYLGLSWIFGTELRADAGFRNRLAHVLADLSRRGMIAALS